MSELYTRDEIDSIVADWNSRVGTAEGTLQSANTNISAHVNAQDAHSNILENKANVGTVNDLSDVVDALDARLRRYELGHPLGPDGTFEYNLSGIAHEDRIDLQLDIQSFDVEHPIVYEPYSGELVDGLSLDVNTGKITGTPTYGGTKQAQFLAKSNNRAVIVTVNQDIEDNTGITELKNLRDKLRANDLSDIEIGQEYTIQLACEPYGSASWSGNNLGFTKTGVSTYSDTFVRYPGWDENGMLCWRSGGVGESRFTNKLTLFKGDPVFDSSGNVEFTLDETPKYMKEYRIKLQAIDTDIVPTNGTYRHLARFVFIDSTNFRTNYDNNDARGVYYPSSTIRNYLSSNLYDSTYSADGFLRRIPDALRDLIVPVTIACADDDDVTHDLSNQLFFVPSESEAGAYKRYYGSSAIDVYTRTPSGIGYMLKYINTAGNIGGEKYANYSTATDRLSIAPAFVIG